MENIMNSLPGRLVPTCRPTFSLGEELGTSQNT